MARATPRVVIVGGSFAGLAAALRLPATVAVTLVEPRPSFEFLPNIHELVSGFKRAHELRRDLQRLLSRRGHRWCCQRAADLDLQRRRVLTAGGEQLDYDWLIVATGTTGNLDRVPGAAKHAMPFRCVQDCAAIGQRLTQLARARGRQPVVIVGGGLEGVEALGEILRAYRRRWSFELTLVERGPRLLEQAPAAVDAAIRQRVAPFEVQIRTGQGVEQVEPERVLLTGGEVLPSALTIWTGGIAPPAELTHWGLTPHRGAFAPVTPTLQSEYHEQVLVAGDAADRGATVAKQAYHALDMGRVAADNVLHAWRGETLKPHRPSAKPTLVTLGDLDTFLITSSAALAGSSLAPLKESVYQLVSAQLEPPQGLGAAAGLLRRAARGLSGQLSAGLGSLRSSEHRGGLRVLR